MVKRFAHMLKLSALTLILLMVSATLLIHIGAADSADGSIYSINQKLLAEKFGSLSDIQTENILTTVGSEANTYVVSYQSKLNEIRKNEELLNQEKTADLIELYYTQGVAANRVAWIYYSYIDDFDGEAKAEIDKVHSGVHTPTQEIDGLQDEIAYAASASDLEQRLDLKYNNGGLCARMYVAVYKQKLLMLLKETDSEAVVAIVKDESKGALVAITECSEFTDNTQYEAIYQKAAAEVRIQRAKDEASKQLEDTYLHLYPGTDPAENAILQDALTAINSEQMTDLTAMNEELQKAIVNLLPAREEEAGAYVIALYDHLDQSLLQRIEDANTAGEIADISSIYDGYTLQLARANAKDTIAADHASRTYAEDDKMLILLEAYNGTDSIIDGCGTMEEIAFEIERARLHADLYGDLLDTVSAIGQWGENSALQDEAYAEYEYTDYKISKIDRLQNGAMDDCVNEYNKGTQLFDELVINAEVLAYETKYAEILEMDASDVTVDDKELLLSAIRDMSDLSEGAKAVFEETRTPDDLANKYKSIVESEIKSLLGTGSDIRKDAVYDLKEQLDQLHITGSTTDQLDELVHNADTLVKKSEAVDSVLDQYEGIRATDEYAGFSETNRTALETLARDTAESICDSTGTEEDFKTLADTAKVDLDKTEACARIDAYVDGLTDMTEETKATVTALAEEAKQKIRDEEDITQIDAITSDALFDMKQEMDIQELTAKAEESIDTVHGMDMLTEEQKQAFEKQIRECLAQQIQSIRSATDETEHNDAVEALDQQISTILQNATDVDEAERVKTKSTLSEELDKLYEQVIAEIDALTYLTEEEREALKQEAAQAWTKGLEAVANSTTAADIRQANQAAMATLSQITDKGVSQNQNAQTTQKAGYTDDIRIKANEILAKLDRMAYLTDQERAAYKKQVQDAVTALVDQLSASASGEDMRLAAQNASAQLDEIVQESSAQDLEAAKQASLTQIRAEEEGLASRINDFRYMDNENRENLKQEGKDTVAEGEASIVACQTVDEVHAARDMVLGDLAEQKKAAELAEDEACVDTLSPYMTGFAIACGVEAVALAGLWLAYRKKNVIACFSPVFALMLMPTPLAWTLTIFLGIADVIMLGLIVYFAIKLWQLRSTEPDISYEAYEDAYMEEMLENLADDTPEDDTPEDDTVDDSIDDFMVDDEDDSMEPVVYELNEAAITDLINAPNESETAELMGIKPILTLGATRKLRLAALQEKPRRPRLSAAPDRQRLAPKPQLIYLMPPAIPAPMASVSVEEANQMIRDEEVLYCQETNIVNTEVYTGWRKAAINIDTINANFSEGEIVTLNTLKEKKLISEKVGYIKILGRGRIEKPLAVIAQSFSASALKMIALTGGAAILSPGAPRRRR